MMDVAAALQTCAVDCDVPSRVRSALDWTTLRDCSKLRNSKFLNLAVDNQVTWPPVETVVNFEGYRLILMPPTREHTTSIHIDLVGQRLTSEKAVPLINRFLESDGMVRR